MNKITAEHLARQAIVYIRQSTADQVAHNLESQRRQYGLADHARQLGWGDVVVIDDDLGRSGSGVARPGFEKLLAAICAGNVGAVVSIEASRLARNGRDGWTQSRVCSLRNHHEIEVYRDGERQERGECTLDEAAEILSLSPSSVRRFIAEGQLPAKQFCKGAPWIIHAVDLKREDVIEAAQARWLRSPSPEDHKQKTTEL